MLKKRGWLSGAVIWSLLCSSPWLMGQTREYCDQTNGPCNCDQTVGQCDSDCDGWYDQTEVEYNYDPYDDSSPGPSHPPFYPADFCPEGQTTGTGCPTVAMAGLGAFALVSLWLMRTRRR